MKKLSELNNLKENEVLETFVMIKSAKEEESKNGFKYINAIITDGVTAEMSAKKWRTTLEDFPYKPGDIIYCRLKPNLYNGTMSANIENCRETTEEDEVKVMDFIVSPPLDIDFMYEEAIAMIDSMTNEGFRNLTKAIYEDHKDLLLTQGAAKTMHHNIYGGLMWHSYRMAKTADAISACFDVVNRDLVVAACLLHDIGKTIEMKTDVFGTSAYTIEGNLLGHLYYGAEMVRRYAKKPGMNIEAKDANALAHIIVSHHGELGFGAIKKPATLEAFLTNYIDMLDSRAYMFDEECVMLEKGKIAEKKNFGLQAVVFNPAYRDATITPSEIKTRMSKKEAKTQKDAINGCLNAIKLIEDEELAILVNLAFEKFKEEMHDPKNEQLMMHIYNTTLLADYLSSVYMVANKDIVIAGALLHDIGKFVEVITDEVETMHYTDDVDLFGHVYYGVETLRELSEECNVDDELLISLLHVVAAHHGHSNNGEGSIQPPAIFEAVLVEYANKVNLKVELKK